MKYEQLTKKLIESGLKETEAKIYACVALNGTIGASSIARTIGTSGPNVSMAAKNLISNNLIEKMGNKYKLSDPTNFLNAVNQDIHNLEQETIDKKRSAHIIAETLNKAYLDTIGKPIVKLLNFDQWQDFRKDFLTEGSDKIIRLIRTERYKAKSNNINTKIKETLSMRKRNNINQEIITLFPDIELDKNDYLTTFFSLEKSFGDYKLDIYIKNDSTVIIYRDPNANEHTIRTIVIKHQGIANSFKTLFDSVKNKSKKM